MIFGHSPLVADITRNTQNTIPEIDIKLIQKGYALDLFYAVKEAAKYEQKIKVNLVK